MDQGYDPTAEDSGRESEMAGGGVRRLGVSAPGGAVFAMVLGVFGGTLAAAADVPPIPDSACATEASFRSSSGDTKASLLIINNTGETLQSIWLDYDGKRVFYNQIAPYTSYVQPTWLTHPWIIANLAGSCYRFLVMTSLEQTVTVNPGNGPPTITASPPTNAPSVAPTTLASVTSTTIQGTTPHTRGSGLPVLLTAGAILAVATAVAAFWAGLHRARIKAIMRASTPYYSGYIDANGVPIPDQQVEEVLAKGGTAYQTPESQAEAAKNDHRSGGNPPPPSVVPDKP